MDGSGSLDFDEVKLAFKKAGLPLQREQLRGLFHKAELDADVEITLPVFRELHKYLKQTLKDKDRKIDQAPTT